MAVWLDCADGFIQADVIRWREGIWQRRGPKGARAIKLGDREVIAEVLDGPDDEGWVTLLVRDCCILTPHIKDGKIKTEEQVRRKAETIRRGKPARLRWSDETARGLIKGSRFIPAGIFEPSPEGA